MKVRAQIGKVLNHVKAEATEEKVGALVYVGGAFAYATKKPDPFPTVFGYHEIFHACTILAAVLHGGMIFTLIHAGS